MGMRDLVNKFTAGELDPRFIAEVDYDGYRKAARKLRNVVAIPQGGATRRFGSFYEATIMNHGAYVTNINQVRLIEYEYANAQIFDIIIRPDSTNVVNIDIYLFGVFQTTVNAGVYTAAQIRDIRWVKDYTRIILLHQAVEPQQLMIIAANNWTLTAIDFVFFPVFDFTSSDNPATLPTPNVPYYSPTVTFTPNAVNATTITANTAVYTSNHVGGIYTGHGGEFRIESVNAGGTIATGRTYVDFIDTSAIPGNLSYLAERAWNDGAVIAGAPAGINRGWPGHGSFYQSRLVLGGSPSLPGTAYASTVNAYYDFDDSLSDPHYGWGVELGVTGNDVITDILATKSLVLIGNKGPASTSILLAEPTTPTNAFLNTQGTEGSRNVNSVIIDNQILYPDRAGNTIWAMSYEIPDTGYNITNASILSTQLIRGPRWADIFDPDNIDGRYYMLVNTDGSMAIYNTIANENIRSWTLATTTGSYIDVSCSANQCKTLTRRQISTTGLGNNGKVQDAYTIDETFNAFRNITLSLNNTASTAVFVNDGDFLLIGNEIQFNTLQVAFATPSSSFLSVTYEFLTDTGTWEVFAPPDDTTGGWQANGIIGWTHNLVDNWKAQTIVGTTPIYGDLPVLYWIRIQRQTDSVTTKPILSAFNIDTQDVIYLENQEFEIVMDCQNESTNTFISDAIGEITGLMTWAGQNAYIFANDFPLKTFYIDSTGTINIGLANTEIKIGLDYTVNITPMPVIAFMQNGISVYEPVHIKYAYVDYFNSLGVTFQGQNLPNTIPGAFMTQQVPVPYTGYYKMPQYGGWDARTEFVISQTYPAPMTILAVSYTMEVSP